jgi:ABC-type sugar transport system permease subunit
MNTPPPIWSRSSEWDKFKDPLIVDWDRVREQIVHEDDLIHQRMTWLITANAFLFGGFFLVLQAMKGQPTETALVLPLAQLILYILPFVGMLLSATVWRAVRAAMRQIEKVDQWWTLRLEGLSDDERCRHPQLIGVREQWVDHHFLIASLIPFTLVWTWVGVFLVVTRDKVQAIPREAWLSALIVAAIGLAYYFGKRSAVRSRS